jgi:hypothetical protein
MREFERFERYQHISDHIDARVLGTTAEEFAVPTGAQWVILTTNAATTAPVYVSFLETSQVTLITNGGFDTDTDWDKGDGWAIANEKAEATNATSSLKQENIGLETGRTYKVTFTTTRTGGSVTAMLGGTGGTGRSTANTFVENIVCGVSPALGLDFQASGFTGSVDAVSVKGVAAVPSADDETGKSPLILCVGMQPVAIGINGITGLSAVAASGTPVLTLAYYG